MVKGCFSQDEYHQLFCLGLLENVSVHWQVLFKKSLLSSSSNSNASTLVNNTPDVSFSHQHHSHIMMTNNHQHNGQSPSLPFVCHDLFNQLGRFLRVPKFAHPTLRIFENILPFIQLYLESIALMGIEDMRHDFMCRYLDYTQSYLSAIAEHISSLKIEISTITDLELVKEKQTLIRALGEFETSMISYFFSDLLVRTIIVAA